MRIGIVAGEHSGDLLASGVMEAIREQVPDVEFEGIAGPRMIALGCKALYPMEKLAVMGLVEVLGSIGSLLTIRRRLVRHFLDNPPDLFIGVDAPDFNLGLECRLKKAGIPTVQYVGPSVWAWRRYRVGRIRRSTDCVLTLFPFEKKFFDTYGVNARFVGHPLADVISDNADRSLARESLGLETAGPVVALLPGSRRNEVRRLSEDFIKTAAWVSQRRPGVSFLVPLVDEKSRVLFDEAMQKIGASITVHVFAGRSLEVMAAADVVLTASGTATLEALLLKRPMVVAYRLARASYFIARRLLSVKYFSLPNLLHGDLIVPEAAQDQVSAEHLGPLVLEWIDSPEKTRILEAIFNKIHEDLRQDANRQVAKAVLELVPC